MIEIEVLGAAVATFHDEDLNCSLCGHDRFFTSVEESPDNSRLLVLVACLGCHDSKRSEIPLTLAARVAS